MKSSQWGRTLFSWKNGLQWYESTELEGGEGTVELVVVRKYDKCVGRRSHLAANDSL